MLNRITIAGRLSSDPELKTTQGGKSVCTVSIACDRDFKDKQTGEKPTDWVSIVAWGQTAEFLSRFFSKGRVLIVDGRLQIREYTDKDGKKRQSTEVVANSIYFGDSNKETAPRNNTSGGGVNVPGPDEGFGDIADDDGELPF